LKHRLCTKVRARVTSCRPAYKDSATVRYPEALARVVKGREPAHIFRGAELGGQTSARRSRFLKLLSGLRPSGDTELV
jgi:hypothetical protein